MCAHLNHLPMGFYGIDTVANDARRHGIPILPPDVQASRYNWTLEPVPGGTWAVRTGLRAVRGIGPDQAEQLDAAIGAGPYRDLDDVRRRTGLAGEALANVAGCGALAGLGLGRRHALWAARAPLAPDGMLPGLAPPEEPPPLPPMTPAEELAEDYRLLGFSPSGHIMTLYREALHRRQVCSLADLPRRAPGETVRIAGAVAVIQMPPTAKGMAFVALEDGSGLGQAILRPPEARRFRAVLADNLLVLVEGVIQQADGVTSVLVRSIQPLG
jgi:error-prone DNA polymerase